MISEQIPVNNHKGNNSNKKFDFNFYIENEEQLLVTHTNLEGIISYPQLGVDYTIFETGYKDGSYIKFPIQGSKYEVLAWDTATDKKEILSISLNLKISQEAEYKLSDKLNLENLEYSLDYLTRLVQINSRKIERAVKVGEGTDIDTDKLVYNINMAIEHMENIDTVAVDRVNIDAVAGNKVNIDTVAGSIENVNKTGKDINNVNIVANDKANIDNVAGNKTNIDTVASIKENVKTVSGISGNVTTVAGISGKVTTVADNKANVDKVAGSINSVNTVSGSINNVNAVAGNKTNIDTVAGDKANIDSVAGNKANIDNCANHMSAIIDAPNQATISKQQADKSKEQADLTTVALAQAEGLKVSLETLTCIDGGSPLTAKNREIYHDAGKVTQLYTNRIDGGSPFDIFLSYTDLKNVCNLRVLQVAFEKAVERISTLESLVADLITRVTSVETNIDCGLVTNR